MTSFNEYQQQAKTTNQYIQKAQSLEEAAIVMALGLTGEAGEVAEKIKKMYRDGYSVEDIQHEVAKELGDVLWYLSQLAALAGYDLQQIADNNLMKLRARARAGTINGSGDNR